jgi:hypothetical protein
MRTPGKKEKRISLFLLHMNALNTYLDFMKYLEFSFLEGENRFEAI